MTIGWSRFYFGVGKTIQLQIFKFCCAKVELDKLEAYMCEMTHQMGPSPPQSPIYHLHQPTVSQCYTCVCQDGAYYTTVVQASTAAQLNYLLFPLLYLARNLLC